MELREGAVVAERFRLVRELGQGGQGSVWLAQHIGLEVPCAVKFINADAASHPEVRNRFEREAKAAAQLRSPNVVQILDYGVSESTPYIAMELLEGEPLNSRLQRHGRLSPAETFRIMGQVGRALSKAHQAGIVHRDLKPENIFLVRDEDAEIAKVLDFGVAKKTLGLSDSHTKTGALLGTPYYMSPEQAQGTRSVDYRSDLWSLAVVAYRCITGTLPFNSDALGDLLIRIVMQPLPVPTQVAADVPPGFDAWWARAAQRDPDQRFQSARELVEAFGAAVGVSAQTGAGVGAAGAPGGSAGLADRPPQPYSPGATVGAFPYSTPGAQPSPLAGQSWGNSTGGTSGGYPGVATGPVDGTSGPSVVGIARQASVKPAGPPKGAVIGAVVAVSLLAAGAVVLVALRSGSHGSAESQAGPLIDLPSATATAEPAATVMPTPPPTATTADPAAVASSEPSSEPGTTRAASTKATSTATATASAKTAKAPTELDVPTATPTGSKKPDFGF